jgi:hypothetical protein
MTTALHRDLPIGEIHLPYQWAYDNATLRETATGFVATDVGKLARQTDDDSLWMLTEDDPAAWIAVGGGGSGISAEAHKVLRQLIHFIDNGPAEGFASGAYREMTGTAFPTAVIWYNEFGVSKKKIVEKLTTWTGVLPTTITWKVYDASEVLLATVTDTIVYSGMFETSRTRAIS